MDTYTVLIAVVSCYIALAWGYVFTDWVLSKIFP
jgi:hypothetical protein